MNLHITLIEKEYPCDTFIKLSFGNFLLFQKDISPELDDDENEILYLTYKKITSNMKVKYKNKFLILEQAIVTQIHTDDPPNYYTIKLNSGTEIQTIKDKLSL